MGLDRLRLYRGFVRRLEVLPLGGRGYRWKDLSCLDRHLPLCPNLLYATYSQAATNSAVIRPEVAWGLLICQSLRSFEVRASPGVEAWPWMPAASASKIVRPPVGASLTRLDLYVRGPRRTEEELLLGALAAGFARVEELGIGCDLVTPRVYDALGRMASLRSLALRSHPHSWNTMRGLQSQPEQRGGFPVLRSLTVRGVTPSHFANLVSSALGLMGAVVSASFELVPAHEGQTHVERGFQALADASPGLQDLHIEIGGASQCCIHWDPARSLLRLPLRRLSIWNVSIGRSTIGRYPGEVFEGQVPELTHLYWRDLQVRDADMEMFASYKSLRVLKISLCGMRSPQWRGDLVVTNPNTIRLESDFHIGGWRGPELSEFVS